MMMAREGCCRCFIIKNEDHSREREKWILLTIDILIVIDR